MATFFESQFRAVFCVVVSGVSRFVVRGGGAAALQLCISAVKLEIRS